MSLPIGWIEAPLGELTSKIGSGATPRGGREVYGTSGVPLIRSMNVHFDGFRADGLAYLDDDQADALANVKVYANDVLLNITGASIGRVCVTPTEMTGARVNQHVCIIRPTESAVARFLGAFLAAPEMQRIIVAENYGLTRQALTKSMIEGFTVPLPPKAEQRRIVSKLDALTAGLARARAELDRVPVLAAMLRKQVLSDATAGLLVQGFNGERWTTGDQTAISARREAYFAERRGSRLRSSLNTNVDWLSEQRSGWLNCQLGDVVSLRVGYAFKSEKFSKEQGVPLLRGVNVAPGRIDWANKEYLPHEFAKKFPQFVLAKGDVVIAMDRPIISTGLKVAQVQDDSAGALLVQRVANPRTSEWILPDYLLTLIRSPLFTRQVEEHATGSDLPHISANDILTMPAPLPPIPVQKAIGDAVKAAFARADRLEAEATRARALLDRLESAILAKAFRGELVPQDPNDEPASVLLDRIRAERAAAPKPKRGRRAAADA
jgi:type I restriction enzyme S subunit